MAKAKRFSKFMILKAPDEFTVYCNKKKINAQDSESEHPGGWTIFRNGAEDDFDRLVAKFRELVEKHNFPKWARVSFSKWMRPATAELRSYHIWIDNYAAYYPLEEAPEFIHAFVNELRAVTGEFIWANSSRFRKDEEYEG